MKAIRTLTFLLFNLFLGLIIGGLITGNNSMLVLGVFFLISDIALGCILQYLIDEKTVEECDNDDFDDASFEEKRASTVVPMNEKVFADIQRSCCWFTLPLFDPVPDIDATQNVLEDRIWKDDICLERHIFAMIFGACGYSQNLTRAKSLALMKLLQLKGSEPENKSPENPEFVKWLGLFAQYNILYGTALVYQHNYVQAAGFLITGLKTRAVNLFMPYCDFIKYVLSKVEDMPAEPAEYKGCGFSADEPMGGLELNGGDLIASAAETVIPALEGDNGEIILAYRGAQSYGKLKRYSTHGKNFRNCIDVYEVLMIDRSFKLKKLSLYFNGYFSAENRFRIRPPEGFHIDPLSEAAKYYDVI